jgi:hypothetical protein
MSEIYRKLEETIALSRKDVDKFYAKGNKAAGTRVRKAMQEIKRLAQELRMDIQKHKKPE